MTFKSWNAEFLHASDTKERLEKAAERDWDLGDLLVRVRVSGARGSEQPQIWVNVSTWRKQEGSVSIDATGKRREGGYFEHEHHASSMLTSNQLRRVSECRQVAEDWVSGQINGLPVNPPCDAVVEVV